MGRQIVADIILEAYLKSLCKVQAITIGLMIGQVLDFKKINKECSIDSFFSIILAIKCCERLCNSFCSNIKTNFR